MPYASIQDLPEAVRKAHPTPHARRVFLATFNACKAEGKDEASCFKIAHAAADRVSAKKRPRQEKASPAHSIRSYLNSAEF